MADLTSKIISSNFQKLLQVDGGVVQDGTGSNFALRVSSSKHVGINADPRTGTTLNVGGDIIATGDVIAENYIVSSSITYMTQSFASGSTIFGDSTDDVHAFTGSISASGDVRALGDLIANGITASTDIHIGGSIIHDGDSDTTLDFSADQLIFNIGGETLLTLTENGSQDIVTIGDGGDVDFKVRTLGDDSAIFAQGSSDNVGIGTTTPTSKLQVEGNISSSGAISTYSHITSSGNISASGTIFASKFESAGTSGETISFNDNLNVTGNITASGTITAEGNISSSAIVKANQLQAFGTTGIISNGSNTFGNGSNDTHEFTGNITASGNISASGTQHIFGANVGIGTISPVSPLQVESTINALTDTDEPENYHLFLRNPANDNGEGVGIAFGTSTATDDVGASLIYKRTAASAKGELQFYVKTNTSGDGVVTQAMTIDDSGNVGIGTTVPTKPLTVEGDISASGDLYVDDDLTVGGSANGRINIGNIGVLNGETNSAFDISSVGAIHYDADSNDNSGGTLDNHIFKIGGSEKMRISGSGNIGIGTTTPTETLQVTGNISASGEVNINATDALFSSKLTVNGDAYCANGGWKLGSAATFIGEITSDSGILTIQSDGQRDIQFNNTSTSASVFIEGQNGNVGIGTTSPTQKLEVHGVTLISGSAPALEFSDIGDNGSEAMIRIDSPDMEIFSGRTGGLHNNIEIRTGDNDNSSTVRMFISGSSGNVGIGTATPSKTLTVVGDISASGGDIYLQNNRGLKFERADGTSQDAIMVDGNDDLVIGHGNLDDIILTTDNGEAVRIKGDGTVGIGTTTPSKALEVAGDISSSGKIYNEESYIELKTAGNDFRLQHEGAGDIIMFSGRSLLYQGTGNVTKVRFSQDGDVRTSGNIFASGSGGVDGHITASGNISSSGTATVQKLNVFGEVGDAGQIYINDGDNGLGVADGFLIQKSGTNAFLYNRDAGNLEIGTDDIRQFHIDDNCETKGIVRIEHGGLHISSSTGLGHITASGNISSSGNVIGNQGIFSSLDISGDIDVDGTTNLDTVDIDDHITIANNKEIKQEDAGGAQRTIIELDSSNDLNIGGSYAGSLKIIGGGSYAEVARFDDDGHFVQVSGKNITTNEITASGNISSSGDTLFIGDDDFSIQNTSGVNGDIRIIPEGELKLGTTSTDIVTVGRSTWVNANSYVDIEAGGSNTLRALTGGVVVGGTATASNAGDSTGDKFSILTVEGNISSSGGITLTKTATTSDVASSSGNVTANNFSISHTLTLNAELADDAEHADITVTTNKCKASSVVVGCASAKVQVFTHTIANGSFKFFFVNKSGGALANDATVVFNFTII